MRIVLALLLSLFAGVNLRAGLMFQTIHPAAVAWRSNTTSLGASSANTVGQFAAVNSLMIDLTQSGVAAKSYWVNPRAGDALGASLCNLIYPAPLGLETNVNLDAADYTSNKGLTANGTDEYTKTGINPRALSVSTNSVGLWASLTVAQGLGVTRTHVGGIDGGNNGGLQLGIYASGTKNMGMIGTPTSGTAEYVEGVSNSIIGLVGIHVKSQPINALSTSVASTTSPGVPGGQALQGIAHDGTYGYAMWSQRLVKYQLADNVPVLTNATPFAAASPTNFNHIGDGCVYNGKLLTVIEGYSSGTQQASNACIAEYSLTDLSLTYVKSITNIIRSAGGCVVGDGVLYVIVGDQEYHDRIYKFDATTYAPLGYLQTQAWFPTIQGIEYTNGFLVVSEGGSDSPDTATYWSINTTNGACDAFMWQSAGISEAEGIMFHGTNLVAANSVSGVWKTQWWPFLNYATNAWRGQHYFVNGAMTNRPSISTKGLANVQMYALAYNNNGTAAGFSTNTISFTAMTSGLKRDEIESLSAAVLRFDRALGRR